MLKRLLLAIALVAGWSYYQTAYAADPPISNSLPGCWYTNSPSSMPVNSAGYILCDINHQLKIAGSITASTSARSTAAAPTYTEATDNPLSTDLAGNLRITGTINATSAAQATAANPSYTEATSNAFSQDLTGHLRTRAIQDGAWTVTANAGTGTFAVSGTFWQTTQPVSGTVTANAGTNLNTSALALDTSVNGLLLAQASTTSGQKGPLAQCAVTTAAPTYTTAQTDPLSCNTAGGVRVDGSGVTQPVSGTFWQATQPISGTVTANAGTGTFTVSGTVTANAGTNLNTSALALDTSVNGLLLAQASTTSGQKGPLAQCAVTTAAPTYTTAQTDPLSCNTAGGVRVDGSGVTQPVSGTVTAQQSTAANLKAEIVGNVTPADAAALGTTSVRTYDINGVYNGSTVDMAREVSNGANTTGAGIPASGQLGQCDDASITALTENSFGNARVDCATHAQITTPVPSATAGGTTLFTLTLAASTNATNVKASAGQVYSISGFNMSSATPVWISLYNNSGTPTCGTSIIQQFLIPGSTTGTGFVYPLEIPKAFATGIAFCATTGIAGTGNPAATTYVLNIDYK